MGSNTSLTSFEPDSSIFDTSGVNKEQANLFAALPIPDTNDSSITSQAFEQHSNSVRNSGPPQRTADIVGQTMMFRLNIAEAKLLSQPSITGKGFWVPSNTKNLQFRPPSTVKRHDSGLATFYSGGDGRLFDSSTLIRVKFNLHPKIEEQYRENWQWGGLPKHIFDDMMSRIEVSEGKVTDVELRLTSDSTWSISHRFSDRRSLSHPLSRPLTIRSVDIGSLRCEYTLSLRSSDQISLVTINGESGTQLFKQVVDDFTLPEDIYKECSFMMNLPKSPHLLRPTTAVVDEFGFRGFLLPFHPAGSLDIVFSDYMGVVLHELGRPAMEPMEMRAGRISWDLKVNWGWDIVKGLRWLHEQDIFWGDLKLDNVVLCLDGCCRFIDYYPSQCCLGYAPPEFRSSITGPQDIFALGLVLWCLAHEIGSFVREQQEVPHLIWAQSIPSWYREIVEKCVDEQAESRPKVTDVYQVFSTYCPAL